MRAWPLVAVAMPLAALLLFLVRPSLDATWENHPAHFWLVLGAAAIATALGWTMHSAARTRGDARLVLVSLAFVASMGFLGLHALATPGVLLGGPNAGFELASPVGLVVAGIFAAAASFELTPERAPAVVARASILLGALFTLMAAWAFVSLAELPPLDDPLVGEQLNGWQLALAAPGVVLWGLAAYGFLRLHRRRRQRFVLVVAVGFVLLAEAMVVIAWARNWQLTWWEWHVLMLGSFLLIALVARTEWHEERFSALYLDETLAGSKDVSILFADLAGFTSFSEQRSAGEVADMLNAYFESLIPLMERMGGDVHQITGDELMVVFGGDGDADHPARAARAGLLLQRTAERLARDHPEWPRFRAGVNSGEVHAGLVGGPRGHRKFGFVGDVVNTSARLQSEAPVGGVLIGEETFRRLGARAVVQPLPPRRVKGKAEPVAAYRLLDVRPRG